ncbi:MAG: GntR family transcriptional regulator [Firmicutes bacterium]|nr:GntR family transcriptional regulator [Bacillota bacterium]
MEWNFDDSRPIWPQIKDKLTREIVSGGFEKGSSFPTVRELAEDAKVNRNTMQRALSELENDGLVITNRTVGRTVTEDEELIGKKKMEIANACIDSFIEEMKSMGYSVSEVIDMMKEKEGNK